MKLATIHYDGREQPALVLQQGLAPLSLLNARFQRDWATDLLTLIGSGELCRLNDWFSSTGHSSCANLGAELVDPTVVRFAPLYRRPRKIWGIGLNYPAHAADLAERPPVDEPASFMRPDTTLIGHGDSVEIPEQSTRTTGEAELAIIMGRTCKDVDESRWLDAVAGYTTVLDMTAEDILRRNPRYLTRAKSFNTFFSLGPTFLTPDEVPNVLDLTVATVLNGRVHAENRVANMIFPPPYLVSFHSRVMPWFPGDILSTGTPQAAHLSDGDVLECRISGFEPLRNPVRDLKLRSGPDLPGHGRA